MTLIVSLCFIFLSAIGQGQFQKVDAYMPSPNAASLGTYGTFPVSHFTGIPQVNIPLYELTSGSLSVPVSLDYHAGGVKADQYPGWTGLNWSLVAGGMISRSVRDLPDEFNCPNTRIKREPFIVGSFSTSISSMGGNTGYWFNYGVNANSNLVYASYCQRIGANKSGR